MLEAVFEIKKFGKMGEKTGWRYIEISQAQAQLIKPDTKVSFRVKGRFDQMPVKQLATLPMGEGNFIICFNAEMRRTLKKEYGATVTAVLELDEDEFQLSADLLECLELDEPAKAFFETLAPGHQRYFSNWIESAKTIETKSKRIEQAMFGLANRWDYGTMYRHFKKGNV